MDKRQKSGFTLIELLVVLAIINLLMSIAIVNVSEARRKGRDARRLVDSKNILIALQAYKLAEGHYPCYDYITSAAATPERPADFLTALINKGYFKVSPKDPINNLADYKVYEYESFRTTEDYGTLANPKCGEYAVLANYNDSASPICPPPGGLSGPQSGHCHIYLPGPPPGCAIITENCGCYGDTCEGPTWKDWENEIQGW